MPTPHDHNQLATLDSMTLSFDADAGEFTMRRTFDLEKSAGIEAAAVADTWEEMFSEAESDQLRGRTTLEDGSFTLVFEAEDVRTRHDLKPLVEMVASEMVSMLGTHDSTQAVALAERLVENAEYLDGLLD